jgi:hypothetical protein
MHAVAGLAPYAVLRSLAHSSAMQTLFAYFGTDRLASEWEHLVYAMGMWRYAGADHGLPYHQNGTGMIRAWILIYPESAGDVAPALEFLTTRKPTEMLPLEATPTSVYPTIETSHAVIRELEAQQSSWAPLVRVGDVVLFTGEVLHRTRFPANFPSDRYAIQATFFAARQGISCYFTRNGVEFPTDDSVAAQARGDKTAEAFELIR